MKKTIQCKHIPDADVLNYLADRQGEWTGLWDGHFNGRENEIHMGKLIGVVSDVYNAMPEGTPSKVALAKMRTLHNRGFVGGCPCGCRGDFEITDKGLDFIGRPRTTPYSGYGQNNKM